MIIKRSEPCTWNVLRGLIGRERVGYASAGPKVIQRDRAITRIPDSIRYLNDRWRYKAESQTRQTSGRNHLRSD